jgi:hypothetical protein
MLIRQFFSGKEYPGPIGNWRKGGIVKFDVFEKDKKSPLVEWSENSPA